jgi:phosphate transport system substrate-binding protein
VFRPFRAGVLALVALGLAASLAIAASAGTRADSLSGAGSTFVRPLMDQWTASYKGASITYNPVGSGAGIVAITNRQVDFGTSDAPLTSDQAAACKGCVQIPWALSSTSVPYNLPGAPPHLRITGKVLGDIFLGKITKWNDAAIRKLNKGVKLPSTSITPIYRSDASGTTYNFTDFLSRTNATFKRKVGNSTSVSFPAGVGARGSSGVDAALRRTEGGITYVDIAYALKAKFNYFRIENRAGVFQLPGLRAIAAAAKSVKKIPGNNELSIVDPAKAFRLAYPICTFTYVIVPLRTSKAAALKSFINWAVTAGQSYGTKLLFSPIPKAVRLKDQKTLKRIRAST